MDLAHKPGTSAHNLMVTLSSEGESDEGEELVETDGDNLLARPPEEVNLYTFSAGAKTTPLLRQPV